MSSILGYTEILLSESVGILGAMQHKFLERIKVSTQRLQGLLDELIQVAALQSDQMNLNPQVVNLVEAIDEAIDFTQSQMLEKNIDLRVSLPEQLPQIHADRDALQQVLIHLLQNACEASPENGAVNLQVEFHDLDYSENYVLIQVSDEGEGIPAEEVPRIFSRLYRAETASIKGIGDSAVGLSIAKTLAEAQGGRIWVDSDSGRGSTFSLLFPTENDRDKYDPEDITAT
jgi:signal transduction histidine kinase